MPRYQVVCSGPAPSQGCTDTPGWDNGYGHGCEAYRARGWCVHGAARKGQEGTLGAKSRGRFSVGVL